MIPPILGNERFWGAGMDAGRYASPPPLLDAKRIHRALFGVYYQEDIFEKFCGAAPLAMRLFGWRVPAEMRRRNLIFLHVPRAQGMSVARALYGPHCIQHYSARYFRTVAPGFWAKADSFAVLREPYDRFASSYAFVRSGGTSSCRLSGVFLHETRNILSIDDYLSFIEERDAFSLDFVMRPQSWFVCDLDTGLPLVKRLFLYGRDQQALISYLGAHGVNNLPWINRSFRMPANFSARQKSRIEKIYAHDFALIEQLRDAKGGQDEMRGAGVAAE